VFNSPNNGVPSWVTEANYIDPQDDSPVQFIAWGLKNNITYSFRVRSYSGLTANDHSAYSKVATVATAAYELRYVSPAGSDTNDGTASDPAHAWKTLAHASAALACGEELIVLGGDYPSDLINMNQQCSPGKKAVVIVSPGEEATITSAPPGGEHTMILGGSYLVLDGLKSASSSAQNGDYDIQVSGNHCAVFNVETHPNPIPTFKGGVALRGGHNLLYRSYLHDAGSPDGGQNPSGNGGFVLVVEGNRAVGNVIWSNHFTRGGHDVSLCIRGANHNRWLNNIMDGGWGMGWEAIEGSQHNLLEGNVIYHTGQLVSFYKPSIEVSSSYTTVRRNIDILSKSNALEVSALYGGDSAIYTHVYNNLFYAPGTCYFQSHNGGSAAYDYGIYQNNICYRLSGVATDIYLDNRKGRISYNLFLAVDVAGAPQPDKALIIWNHSAEADFQYPKPVSYADTHYSPPFFHNRSLAVPPRFTDESRLDFHLSVGSALIKAGSEIADSDWGSVSGKPDLGAFGIDQSFHPTSFIPIRAGLIIPATTLVALTDRKTFSAQTEKPLRSLTPDLHCSTMTRVGLPAPVATDLHHKSAVSPPCREAVSPDSCGAMPLVRVDAGGRDCLEHKSSGWRQFWCLSPRTKDEVELQIVAQAGYWDFVCLTSLSRQSITADTASGPMRSLVSETQFEVTIFRARDKGLNDSVGGPRRNLPLRERV
jgi:hypothetical protein